MKRISALIALLLMILLLPLSASAADHYQLGERMEDFTVTLLDGETQSLYGLLAEKDMVVINFFASWCGPCKQEFPYMQAAYQTMSDEVGLLVLSVEPTDSVQKLESLCRSLDVMALPMGRDTAGVSDRFDTTAIPTTVIVDRFGCVAFMLQGAIYSTEQFCDLWGYFTSDDYTQTRPLRSLNDLHKPDAATDAALSAALNAPGGDLRFTTPEGAWPFLPAAEGGAAAAVHPHSASNSWLSLPVSVQAGDVLRYEYKLTDVGYEDYIVLRVNGENAGYQDGSFGDWQEGSYRFAAAGDYTVEFIFVQRLLDERVVGGCQLRNVSLLSGEAAAAFVPYKPILPTIPGSAAMDVELLSPGCERLQVELHGALITLPTDLVLLYAPMEELALRFRLGAGNDLANTIFVEMHDEASVLRMLSSLPYDAAGFLHTLPLDQHTLLAGLVTYPSAGAPCMYLIATDLDELEYIVAEFLGANREELTDCRILRADGTVLLDMGTEDSTLPDGMYRVLVTDAQGQPLPGVMVQICDESICQVLTTDDQGMVQYEGGSSAYEAHILFAPEGYAAPAEVLILSEDSRQATFILPGQ